MASMSPLLPTLTGNISSVPDLINFHASHNPHLAFAFMATDADSPVFHISFIDFAHATRRVAHAVRPDMNSSEREVVAVLVNCDTILHLALFAGMLSAGVVPLLISPEASPPVVMSMLQQTSCHWMICQRSFAQLLGAIKSELAADKFTLRVDDLPDFDDIFPSLRGYYPPEDCHEWKPDGDRPAAPRDVAFYSHGSRPDGSPAPVRHPHLDILQACNHPILLHARRAGIVWGAMGLPPSDPMATFFQLYAPLVSGCPIALFSPRSPRPPVVPTPQSVLEACRVVGCTGVAASPVQLEAWAKSEEDVQYLKSLSAVIVCGSMPSGRTSQRLVADGVPLHLFHDRAETHFAAHL